MCGRGERRLLRLDAGPDRASAWGWVRECRVFSTVVPQTVQQGTKVLVCYHDMHGRVSVYAVCIRCGTIIDLLLQPMCPYETPRYLIFGQKDPLDSFVTRVSYSYRLLYSYKLQNGRIILCLPSGVPFVLSWEKLLCGRAVVPCVLLFPRWLKVENPLSRAHCAGLG